MSKTAYFKTKQAASEAALNMKDGGRYWFDLRKHAEGWFVELTPRDEDVLTLQEDGSVS